MQEHEHLEEMLGQFVNPNYPNPNVAACSSGTAALHLALEALELPRGGEVILCDFNMIACARAVVMAGLVPVFVDCTNDLLLDETLLDEALTKNTVAVIATHIYGRRCDMEKIVQFCVTNSLICIEDMAEIHGVSPARGTDAACYSFYKNKIIAGEEGGAVVFHKARSYTTRRARQLRSLGFTDEHDFTHIPYGHNYRMSNIHAKLIIDSLRNVEDNVAHRRKVEALYDKCCPAGWQMPYRDAPWVYDMRIEGLTKMRQAKLVSTFKSWGTRHAFKPMSRQDEFQSCYLHCHDIIDGSLASKAAQEIIYLPLLPGNLVEEEVRDMFATMQRIAWYGE